MHTCPKFNPDCAHCQIRRASYTIAVLFVLTVIVFTWFAVFVADMGSMLTLTN